MVAIADIDTRKLTRILREKGAQSGCIMAGFNDEAEALKCAREFPGLIGMDLAKVVSCTQPYEWNEGEWRLGHGFQASGRTSFHVVALDFGIKRNMLRKLAQRHCRVTVFPAQTTLTRFWHCSPDGVFLSNGPGDPEPCDYAIAATQKLLEKEVPIFGVCMGHQLLGLASGGKNHKDEIRPPRRQPPGAGLDSGKVAITSQNHGFAVDIDTLPKNAQITHLSLFDGSLQGFELPGQRAFCFQGHPEASPGPHDLDYLFDKFIESMKKTARQRTEV